MEMANDHDQVARTMIEAHIRECERSRRDMNGQLSRIFKAIEEGKSWRLKTLLWIVGGSVTLCFGLLGYIWTFAGHWG